MNNKLRQKRFEKFINIIAGLIKDQRSGDDIIHLSVPITYHPLVGIFVNYFGSWPYKRVSLILNIPLTLSL